MRPLVLLLALLALVVAGCGGGDEQDNGGGASRSDGGEAQPSRVEVVEGLGDEGGFDAKAIYDSEAPGVVTVISLFNSGGLDSVLGGGEGGGGVGSGFVLNGEGEIATNAHVVSTGEGEAIRRARSVFVEFADGNQVPAKIMGTDPNADIALLKIDPAGLDLRPLPLGESSSVEVGEPVAAIGSPFGEQQSLSVGVISAIDRSIQSLTDFSISGAIQTDAAINPGNSGGPLVDMAGWVIGINSAIYSPTGAGQSQGGSVGIGFAIPIDQARRTADEIVKTGKATQTILGVTVQDGQERGARIVEVNPDGPGAKAGLKPGDVVTKLDDRTIETSDALVAAVRSHKPGDKVRLELSDGSRSVDATLAGQQVETE
jgi:putative serine protease PepD